MYMGIDEAWNHDFAVKVDLAGLWPRQLANLQAGTDRENFPSGNRNRFAIGKLRIHFDDFCVKEDHFGGRPGGLRAGVPQSGKNYHHNGETQKSSLNHGHPSSCGPECRQP